jgi:methionine aminopeptidase, type I
LIILKSESEIAAMRKAGRVVAQAHALVRERLRPGVTTADIDSWVEEFLRRQGAVSAFKGYQGYPACTCTSVNDEVVHGIPGPRVLEEGDIVSVDIGAFVDGFCGDMAWTYPVGQVSELAQKLLRVTEEALMKGIEQAVAGNRLSDIGHAVQTHVEAAGFSVVKSFVGHGIGRSMHEAPQVPNFGRPGRGPRLKVGMTLAIEPMVNVGTDEVRILDDNWTAVTADGSLSAHFEHTVAVREGYAEILTAL